MWVPDLQPESLGMAAVWQGIHDRVTLFVVNPNAEMIDVQLTLSAQEYSG